MSSTFKNIQSNQRIFIHGGSATPFRLIQGLLEEAPRLSNVELIHLHTLGEAAYANSKFANHFKVANLFVGPNMRKLMHLPQVDYLPCFLSEIPNLFRSGRRKIDVALVHLSPPDKHGFCTLGTNVDVAKAAVESAEFVIAQINPRMPRIHGDGFIHIKDVDEFIEIDEPIPEVFPAALSPQEMMIGKYVAELVENGSTLQVGIGAVPDAALENLKDHKNLGVHTEMWSDGVLKLIQSGAIDNTKKNIHPGKCVSGFITGTKAVYDFIHDNPSVIQLDIGYVNKPSNIARNPKVVAINSAVEIDLTGQVCADSVGSRIISGVGGQMDFMQGAAESTGGKPIIAMTSRTHSNRSRIVSTLAKGAGVVSTRAHVHFVITEYGIADLYGKTLSERARSLIQIAHPEDREQLQREWQQLS